MPARPADLRGALVADLPRGRIETRDRRRLVALPTEWLDALVARAPADAVAALGSALATQLEPDARAALAGEQDPSPEDLAYALSAAFAARGLGLAAFEQWGDAVALVWRDPPVSSTVFGDIAASAAATLVSKLTGLNVSGAVIGSENGELRVLLASQAVCDHARSRVKAGDAFATILARLERGTEAR